MDRTSDLVEVPALDRLGLLLGFQDSTHFRTTDDVGHFFGLGQRVSQLTYNEASRLGSGCRVPRDRGLTAYGAEIVAAMNRVGMAVDVSHCGERTSLDAIACSSQPVLVTHSNCAALVPGQPRCKSDAVIRAMAAGGGVLGITVVRPFVGHGNPGLGDLLDHFVHVARLVGIEHVGLGSDVDVDGVDPSTGRVAPLYSIRGLDLPTRVFQIADGLLGRGFTERHVELVLGGNFRRALSEIWRQPAAPPDRPLGRDPFCEPDPPPEL